MIFSTTIVLYCIVLNCIELYCIELYCIVLHCIVLYCIVLCGIVWYCRFKLFSLLLKVLSSKHFINYDLVSALYRLLKAVNTSQ